MKRFSDLNIKINEKSEYDIWTDFMDNIISFIDIDDDLKDSIERNNGDIKIENVPLLKNYILTINIKNKNI